MVACKVSAYNACFIPRYVTLMLVPCIFAVRRTATLIHFARCFDIFTQFTYGLRDCNSEVATNIYGRIWTHSYFP